MLQWDEMNETSFGARLDQAMNIRDLEPKELAHKSGVSLRYIHALLSGEGINQTITKNGRRREEEAPRRPTKSPCADCACLGTQTSVC